MRSFTLLVFLVFLFVVFRSLKSKALEWQQIDSRLVFFFLIVNPLTLLFAFTFRPEILVMSLGFFSFLLLKGKHTNAQLILSAALAGTALLVHLNGLMFIVAGFALLLPIMAFIAASFFTELKKTGRPVLQAIGIVLILFQISSAAIGLGETFGRRENTAAILAKTLSGFPGNNEKVLVPYRFVFNQLPEKNLISYKTMEFHQVENGEKFTKNEFLELALQLVIHCMVVSPEMLSHNKMYPWMNEEFKDDEKGSFVKLKIEPGSNNLLWVE
ncbi:MAG: hypothetical protein L3J31_04965 [Bacteroidales bacterium]|nr:hypothetical protein [Bacteroidales bacterium]